MGRKETLVTAASIISKSFEFNHALELTEEQFSQLVEDKYSYVSQGTQKIERKKYTFLRNTYDVLLSGGVLPKYNYIFRIDTIKVVSLMNHIQENIQFKAGRLRNAPIAGYKIKIYTCV